jgi:peptide-methionine (S)-S-oxide reductase
MGHKQLSASVLSIFFLFLSCSAFSGQTHAISRLDLTAPQGKAIAAFAEGCFWCSEHIFESVYGVDEAISGYAGGRTPDPTYESVNTETTGHAETVYVIYDPLKITYKELCRVFFDSHDPTTKDKQGPDVGNSYRSILFFITEQERKDAEAVLKEWTQKKKGNAPIVTEIKKLTDFYKAEEYHQDFILRNPRQSYVTNVSIPRYELFRKTYKGKFKD